MHSLGYLTDDPYIDNTTERSMDEQTRKALELARDGLKDLWKPLFGSLYIDGSRPAVVVAIQKAITSIDAALSAPAAPVAQWSEHIAEIRATLSALHALCEELAGMERRIGPAGSHARGATWKITKAIEHLDALAATSAPVAQDAEKLAREAHGYIRERMTAWDRENLRDCIDKLAGITIPQPAQAPQSVSEPAFYVTVSGRLHEIEPTAAAFNLPDGRLALFIIPAAPRAPLTDEQILEIAGCAKENPLAIVVICMARAIERAHGIGQGDA